MNDIYTQLAEEYCNSSIPIDEIISQPKYKNEPFIQMLQALRSLMQENETKSNQILMDAAKYDKAEYNPIAKMIFYMMWAHASLWKSRKQQVALITEKARLYNPPSAPPIILSTIELSAAFAEGSNPAYLKKFLEEYKKYGKTSPRFRRLLDNYVRLMCSSGLGCTSNKKENVLEQFKFEITPSKDYYFYQFLNDLGTCNLKSIQTYFHKLNLEDNDIKVWLALYELLEHKTLRIQITEKTTSFYQFFNAILQINYLLMQQQPQEAYKCLQKIQNGIWGHVSSNFLKYTQIRTELAVGNIEAAFQHMKAKIKNGDGHYMDDFFLGRIELAKDNREKALFYFARALQKCEFYQALPRYDIELDLSYEIKKSDLFYIAKNISNKNSKKFKNTMYDEIIETKNKSGLSRIIGDSPSIKTIKDQIKKMADAKLPVLIRGETGSGKDVIARAIHEESSRNKDPFVAINCAAIADSLLQSELFGHEAGAYTGASQAHQGIFEEAGEGTVFLDEIGEISPAIQVALLRVLENYEIRPVGKSKTVPIHCRIITATNAHLEKLIEKKLFREDLYYRLKQLEIMVPPLRERTSDITPIALHFLSELRNDEITPTLSSALQKAMNEYPWPGNIRQLKAEIEKMDLLHSRKNYYDVEDMDLFIATSQQKSPQTSNKAATQIQNEIDLAATWRRQENLRQLFQKYQTLTRKEISKLLQISLPTATTDLKKLLAEKYIKKIEPSTSPRSHYFQINQK